MGENAHPSMEELIQRMAEPSWLILGVLIKGEPKPAIHIKSAVEGIYATSDYPIKKLDAATLHYAIERMQTMGILERPGEELVDVPVGHNSFRTWLRPVYQITETGRELMGHRLRMLQVLTEITTADDPSLG